MAPNSGSERKLLGKSFVIVTVAAVLPYIRGVSNLFVAEDFDVLLLSSLDFPLFWRVVFASAVRIKPLPLLKDWLSYQIWGANPIGYHVISLLFHFFCSFLVCYLGYLLLKDARAGIIGGLVFAVYPRHHSAVLWLAASQFVLSTFFVLAGLVLFIIYLRRRQWRYYLLFSVCVVLAPFTQETGVLLLPFAFLIELLWRCEAGESWWAAWRNPGVYRKYIPWLLFLVVFIVFSFSGPRAFKLQTRQVDPRLVVEAYHFLGINVARVKDLLTYLTYLVWPQLPLHTLDVNLGSLALAGFSVCVLLVLFIKGKSSERFLLTWMLGALLPSVFFSPFGPTDRYFYLAGVGFALLLGQLGAQAYRRFQERWSRILLGGVLCLYVVSSAVLLQARIVEWREAGEMAQDVIEQVLTLHPQVPPRSQMFFVSLPKRHGQAYVFLGGGIGGAMRTAYGDLHLKVYRSFDSRLEAWLVSGQGGDPTPGEYVFLYKGGRIEDKSAYVDDFEAFYESWWWYR